MSDINSEITKWIAIAKGDLPGHPFHGNQYGSASGRAEALSNVGGRMFVRDAKGPERNTWGGNSTKDFEDIGSGHSQLEADHRASAASEYASGNMKAGDLHIAAARAHADAGDEWRKSNEAGYTHAQRDSGVHSSTYNAYTKSGDARDATIRAENASDDAAQWEVDAAQWGKDL
jgi:hypothetical protein